MRDREREVFKPNVENLGKNCSYWSIDERCCQYPKKEIFGRESCDGIVESYCLYYLTGRIPKSLSPEQVLELKTRVPVSPLDIPPGDTIA